MQFELCQLVLNQPELYGPIIGLTSTSSNSEKQRQHLFTTMWIRYVSFVYETGAVSDAGLRDDFFAYTFASEEGRRWYRVALPNWVQAGEYQPHIRKFVSIMQDEYDKAMSNALSSEQNGGPNL